MEPMKSLSRRESEVVPLILQGKSNKQIALSLGISERTVEFHLKNIYAKLQVNSKVELILKLGETTGRLNENPVVSTVDVWGAKRHNGKQSTERGRWIRPLKNILFTARKEFAVMKIMITEDVRNFIKAHINVHYFLFWTPRVLCILFAMFLSLFALDVFTEGRGIAETLLALLIHLIPALLVLAVLVITWRRDWVGTILFMALSLLYAAWSRRLDWIVVISTPLFLIGTLFLLNWIYTNTPNRNTQRQG